MGRRGYVVCLCPTKRTPSLYELINRSTEGIGNFQKWLTEWGWSDEKTREKN